MKECPHCGCDIDQIKGRPRSLDQLRRFFSVLRVMFKNWPEQHEFQPESEEHLRKWVIAKAGHRESTDIAVEFSDNAVSPETCAAIESAIKSAGAYAFVRPHACGGLVRVYRPKSIAFSTLTQGAFNKLNDDVEAIYKNETGVDADVALKTRAA